MHGTYLGLIISNIGNLLGEGRIKMDRKGMTLVEVILALALLGIIAVSLISGFSSQLININRGTDITVGAMDAQSDFENLIFDVKTKIQEHEITDSWVDLVDSVPEWSEETLTIIR